MPNGTVSDIETITTLQQFAEVFGLPIAMSLIGGLIGHFVKNGIIELPKLIIEYSEEHSVSASRPMWRRACSFVGFALGLRGRDNASQRLYVDLGFLGDLLIAIGTGILAKTALALANTDSPYAVISTSLLAGYAGLSYLKAKQTKDLANTVIEEIQVGGEGNAEKQGVGDR